MAITWKLQGGMVSSATTAGDLGLSQLVLSRRSLAADELTFTADGAAVDSAALFAYGDTVTLTGDNGTGSFTKFKGVCTQVPRSARGRGEDLRYTISGTWWYLENLVFQQNWPTYASSTSRRAFIVAGFSPPAGTRQNTKAFVQDVLDWLLGSGDGPVLQYSAAALPTGFEVPFTRLESPTCAEALRHICRWMPDAASSFDYTTTPPTLRIKRRSGATTTELALTDGSAWNIAPRYDLQLDRLVIQYVSYNGSGGTVVLNQEVDPVGTTGREFGCAVFVVDNDVLPIASGLAAAYRAGLSTLQYAGQAIIEARDCATGIDPGMLLNVTGGPEDWETMNAQVQEVIEELDAGRTTLRMGPPNHIGLDDLIEILKISRGQVDQYGGTGEILKSGNPDGTTNKNQEITQALTVAGIVPTWAEISDAVAAAYSGKPKPRTGDVVWLTYGGVAKFGAFVHTLSAALPPGGKGVIGFTLSSSTYYAHIYQVVLW